MEVKKVRGIKAVLFDLDGTLLRLPIDYKKMRDELKDEALEVGAKCEFARILEDIECLSVIYGNSFKERCYEIIKTHEISASLHAEPLEGGIALLEELKLRGVKIGVVSRNSRESVISSLQKTGMLKFVDVIVGREDVKETKPAPEPILLALRLLCVGSEETLYVGDHPYDLISASAAGVEFIGIGERVSHGKRVKKIQDVLDFIMVVNFAPR
ncbi:MAG: HAD family hydrolase [Candidatus Methanomethylicaceae archaeon]